MKTCEELIEYLGAYADDELEGDVCERVRRHLAECESCRKAFEDMKRTTALYRDSSVPEPTDAQWAKVAQAVARCQDREEVAVEPTRRRLRDWHWWLSGVLAAAAVILVVFVLPHRPHVVTPLKEGDGKTVGRVESQPKGPTAVLEEVESLDRNYMVEFNLPRDADDTLIISLVRAPEAPTDS